MARQVLAPVSLWMQATLQKDEAPREVMHTAMQTWLDTLNTLATPPEAALFCDFLVKRAGLLVDSGDKEYLFRHKSFREYLAGVQLKEDRPYEQLQTLVTHFGEDWWTEPLRFFIASVDAGVFDAFMEKLFNSPQSEALNTKQQLLLQTIIEEAKGQKVDALCTKLLDPETTAGRQRVILDCLKAINKPAAAYTLQDFRARKLAKNDDVADRAEEVILAFGGKALERATEKSVGGKPASFRNQYEEKTEYILIPKGSYLDSETNKIKEVKNDLYFAKYSVTNKRYRSFIAALGKSSKLQEELKKIAQKNTWDKGFAAYLKEGKNDLASLFRSTYDEDRKFGGDDQPVVGITWYAAQAYCLWLSQFEGKPDSYRLPTEVEWEWAAGGRQGEAVQKVRNYPWPDENRKPDSKLLNYNSNVGQTTPVGSYPEGATPEGLYDMAGNVREWTDSWEDESGSNRVIRGGSWSSYVEHCRSANRGRSAPDGRRSRVGFRPVFVP